MTSGIEGFAPHRSRPLGVDVVMTTYNHERFIARAIESVVVQKADFPLRLFIGEDGSTDRTREVVTEFARRHPKLVFPILRPRNVGAPRNFADLLRRCSARYVALLEGDDYWTSPQKLAKQVAYLESEPACSMCFHDVVVFPDDRSAPASFQPYQTRGPRPGGQFSLADLLHGNFIQTCSVMLRAGLVTTLPEWFFGLVIDDWPFFALNAAHGPIGHIPEVMAAYRVHAGGVWSGRDRPSQQLVRMQAFDAVNAHFGYAFDAIVRGVTAQCCFDIATGLEKKGDLVGAARHALEALRRRPHGTLASRLQLLRVLFRGHAPALYAAVRNAKRSAQSFTVRRRDPANRRDAELGAGVTS
jgi:glycosyltransferase involved in cell wall biosynthesis